MPRLIITRATACAVERWATRGKKRLRNKYRHNLTACRVLNRRECPIVGEVAGRFGVVFWLKMAYGHGCLRRRASESGVGWYGDWHLDHSGSDRPLDGIADLRAWIREVGYGIGAKRQGRDIHGGDHLCSASALRGRRGNAAH